MFWRMVGGFYSVLLSVLSSGWCQQFDVLKVSDVEFPRYFKYAASTSAPYNKNITEFTVCYRILIESYNDGQCNTNIFEYSNIRIFGTEY